MRIIEPGTPPPYELRGTCDCGGRRKIELVPTLVEMGPTTFLGYGLPVAGELSENLRDWQEVRDMLRDTRGTLRVAKINLEAGASFWFNVNREVVG